MGSAALFFAIAPGRALLADANADLVETFVAVRDQPGDVYDHLTGLMPGRDTYQALRALTVGTLTRVERAARFVFLNRFCFNGLYRTNRDGKFNVPYAPTRSGSLPSWDQFQTSADLLRRADLECEDFETVLRRDVRAGDFVYLDPPYAVANRRIFRQYGPHSFGLHDIARLARALHEINDRGATFVLSYAFCKEARDAFGQWHTRKVFCQRNISGFVKHRRRAAELIVSNARPEEGVNEARRRRE